MELFQDVLKLRETLKLALADKKISGAEAIAIAEQVLEMAGDVLSIVKTYVKE